MNSRAAAKPPPDDGQFNRPAKEPRREWNIAILKLFVCLVAFIAAALPIALPDNLLLADYPEHLAEHFILENLNSSPYLDEFYEKSPGFYPYQGIRFTVGLLTLFLDPESAVRWFTTLATLMPAVGCCVLGWTLARRITLLPLASLLFIYNNIVSWGFLNYLFSGGVALVVFAAWIWSARQQFALRLISLALAAFALIWMHPFAAVLLGLLICLWEVADLVGEKHERKQLIRNISRILMISAAFLPAGMSLVMLSQFNVSAKFLFSGDILYQTSIILSALSLDLPLDVLDIGGLNVAIVAGLLLTGLLRLHPNSGRLFFCLMFVTLLTPVTLFGVFNAGIRIPTFAFMVLAAGLRPGEHFAKVRSVAALSFSVLLCAKLYSDAFTLSEGSKLVSELRSASSVIPVGSKVFTISEDGSMSVEGAQPRIPVDNYALFLNLDSYLIVDRQVLVPNIFATVGVGYREKYHRQVLPLGTPAPMRVLARPPEKWHPNDKQRMGFLRQWRIDYDYVLLLDFGVETKQPRGTELLIKGSYFRFLKVLPDVSN